MKVKFMNKDEKSPAPALEKGLEILEKVAAGEGIAFNRIVEELSMPESSAVRYLKVLLQLGYVRKDLKTGLYFTGEKVNQLVTQDSIIDKIREKTGPVLRNVMLSTGNTALFIYWNGTSFQCLGKELNENSIAMQSVNDVRYDILDYPWSPFVFNQFSESRRKIELKQYPDSAEREKFLKSRYEYFLQNGYCLYESDSIRRIAVPVFMRKTDFCGALAIGGTLSSITKNGIDKYGRCLKEYASLLSQELTEIK